MWWCVIVVAVAVVVAAIVFAAIVAAVVAVVVSLPWSFTDLNAVVCILCIER